MSQNQNTNQNTAQQTGVAQQTGAQNTASRAANATITAAPTGGNNTAAANATSSVSIPSDAADGWIDMKQPPQVGSSSYYKIAPSEFITFKWNMTSVL